jgi:signal peptidase I
MSDAPRSRLIAGLLSICVPGLGQIYLGQRSRGFAFLAVAIVLPVVPAIVASELGTGLLVTMLIAALAVGFASAIDAMRFCKESGRVPIGTLLGVGLGFYFVAPIVVAILLRVLVVEAFKIPSGAMMPTLMVGDHLFADKLVFRKRAPARGEQMIFAYPEHPNQDFVKRVIAVGGDKIEVRGGHPVINGWEVPSCNAGTWSYDDEGTKHAGDLFVEFLDGNAYLTFYERGGFASDYQGPWTIEAGHTFVMGDNRNNSHDSRMWFGGAGGTVPPENVKGRPRWIWLSEQGRGGIDVSADPVAPHGADAAAISKCLGARPPRNKTIPPQK